MVAAESVPSQRDPDLPQEPVMVVKASCCGEHAPTHEPLSDLLSIILPLSPLFFFFFFFFCENYYFNIQIETRSRLVPISRSLSHWLFSSVTTALVLVVLLLSRLDRSRLSLSERVCNRRRSLFFATFDPRYRVAITKNRAQPRLEHIIPDVGIYMSYMINPK